MPSHSSSDKAAQPRTTTERMAGCGSAAPGGGVVREKGDIGSLLAAEKLLQRRKAMV